MLQRENPLGVLRLKGAFGRTKMVFLWFLVFEWQLSQRKIVAVAIHVLQQVSRGTYFKYVAMASVNHEWSLLTLVLLDLQEVTEVREQLLTRFCCALGFPEPGLPAAFELGILNREYLVSYFSLQEYMNYSLWCSCFYPTMFHTDVAALHWSIFDRASQMYK